MCDQNRPEAPDNGAAECANEILEMCVDEVLKKMCVDENHPEESRAELQNAAQELAGLGKRIEEVMKKDAASAGLRVRSWFEAAASKLLKEKLQEGSYPVTFEELKDAIKKEEDINKELDDLVSEMKPRSRLLEWVK